MVGFLGLIACLVLSDLLLVKRVRLEISWLNWRGEIRDIRRLHEPLKVDLVFDLRLWPPGCDIVSGRDSSMLVVLDPYLGRYLSFVFINGFEFVHILWWEHLWFVLPILKWQISILPFLAHHNRRQRNMIIQLLGRITYLLNVIVHRLVSLSIKFGVLISLFLVLKSFLRF